MSTLASLHSRHSSAEKWPRQVRSEDGSRSKWKNGLHTVLMLLRSIRGLFLAYRHRSIRKRALLIGIAYKYSEIGELRGTHEDVDYLHGMLVKLYGFREADITVMKDVEGTAAHLWPTEHNIRRELQNLTWNCQPRDRFFFSYAGHAGQKKERVKGSEYDGMDEFIIPYDAPGDEKGTKCIVDDDLRKYLVVPLKKRCKLVAVLDACHSATLLDLTHDSCLEMDGWRGKVTTVVRWAWEIITRVLGVPVPNPAGSTQYKRVKRSEMEGSLRRTVIPAIERLLHPLRFCLGLCRRAFWLHDPCVLCFSACRDEEEALEMGKMTMSKVLVSTLEKYAARHPWYPYPRLAKLKTDTRAKFQSVYEGNMKRHNCCFEERRRRGKAFPGRPWLSCLLRWTPSWLLFCLPAWMRGLPDPVRLQLTSNLPRYTHIERFWI